MAYWTDIADARIAADSPPNGTLFAMLRERDKANASKQLPLTDVSPNTISAHKGDVQDINVWTQAYTTRLFIPHDVPAGWVVYYPFIAELYWDSTPGSGAKATLRLLLGSTYSSTIVQTSFSPMVKSTTVVIEPALRGTHVDLAVEANLANATQAYGCFLDPPKSQWAGTASVRRP